MRRNITYRALFERHSDDWFLPSLDALVAMYTNLHLEGVGDFSITNWYWSSSEYSASIAYLRHFGDGGQVPPDVDPIGKVNGNRVRACRKFTTGVGDYNLRDIGPRGGLIFYIDDTTYYEAASSDQGTNEAWSNITAIEIGITAQGTAIGTGQANTNAIIAQAGHTNSAAKLCDDLIV